MNVIRCWLRLLLETYLGTRLISLGWCRSAPALPSCAVLALLPARSSTSTGKTTAKYVRSLVFSAKLFLLNLLFKSP